MEISIVGYAARLPGAGTLEDVWRVFSDGHCTVSEIPEDRWSSIPFLSGAKGQKGRSYTRRAGILEDPFCFDPAYFGISPLEAEQMDPQQRLLLETTAHAFDQAGVDGTRLDPARTGVFVGASAADHSTVAIRDPSLAGAQYMLGNTLSILANRIAYHWGFTGPSFTIDTACSSALFALDQARRLIADGTIDTAVVGGVNLLLSPIPFVGFSQANMLSRRGLCRAFAKDADGYVRSEGAVVFVLQRTSLARATGLSTRSVLVATAVNSDGGGKSGMSIPSASAQESLISNVVQSFDIDPCDLAFVEAHGTGTAVGDPAEALAIGRGYGRHRAAPVPIGSAKTNFGHLEPAAGLVGLLKAQLALEKRLVPASLHAEELNPDIDFDALNVQVQRETESLPERDRPWLAAVNSFGFGGANAHAVIRESAADPRKKARSAGLPPNLLITAATARSLERLAGEWQALADGAAPGLASRMSLANRRLARNEKRLCVKAGSTQQLSKGLKTWLANGSSHSVQVADAVADNAEVAFIFSGNGAVFAGMAREIFHADPVFRKTFGAVARLLRDFGVSDLRHALSDPDDSLDLEDAAIAQPLHFAVQIALVEALSAAGVRPAATLGHSVGEVAAAVAAKRISIEDGARIVASRSTAFAVLKDCGAMAAVAASADTVRDLVREAGLDVEIAAENAPQSVTIAGPGDDIDRFLNVARARRVAARALRIPYPYHTRSVDRLEDGLRLDLAAVESTESSVAFFSGWLGRSAGDVSLDADYWWQNARSPVSFRQAVTAMGDAGFRVFVEVTPRTVLRKYIQDTLSDKGVRGRLVETLDPSRSAERTSDGIVRSVLAAGGRVDEDAVLGPVRPVAETAPDYPFDGRDLRLSSDRGIDVFAQKPHHPFLGARADPQAWVWTGRISLFLAPWLADHRVGGRILFPAMGVIEMMTQAACEVLDSDACELRDIEFTAPIHLVEGTDVRTKTSYEPGSRRLTIEIAHMQDWLAVAVCRVLSAGSGYVNRDLPFEDGEPADRLYSALAGGGLDYGPQFALVEGIRRRLGGVDARVCGEVDGHPAASVAQADAALHAAALILDVPGGAWVPFRVSKLTVHGNAPVRFSRCSRAAEHADQASIDVVMCDGDGQVIIEIASLGLQELAQDRHAGPGLYDEVLVPLRPLRRPFLAGALSSVLRGPDDQPTDLDVLRSSMAGRLAWDILESTDSAEHDQVAYGHALGWFLDLGLASLDAGRVRLNGECPWPDADTLLRLLLTTCPAAVDERERFLRALQGALPGRRDVSRRLARKAAAILDSADPGRPRRILFTGDLSRELLEALRRIAAYIVVVAGDANEIGTLQSIHGSCSAARFCLFDDVTEGGGFDAFIAVGQRRPSAIIPVERLQQVLGEGCEILFLEEAEDDFSILTSGQFPLRTGGGLDTALNEISRLDTAHAAESDSILIHYGVVGEGPQETAEREAAPGGSPSRSPEFVRIPRAASIAKRLEFLDRVRSRSEPVTWILTNHADEFEELTGWRRTLVNETGKDIRLLACETSDESDPAAVFANAKSAETEVLYRDGAPYVPRIVPFEPQVRPGKGETLELSPDFIRSPENGSWRRKKRRPPGAGEVEIEVKAVGVNFRDILLAHGLMPSDAFNSGFTGHRLGMECAGTVVGCGEGSRFRAGDRVMAFASGAFSSHVTVSQTTVLGLPDDVDFAAGAALPVVFLTADYALRELARARKGETVLIHGAAGGVGMAAIQIARQLGLRIVAGTGSQEKRRLIKALGVDCVVDSRSSDFDRHVLAFTGGTGVDIVLNSLAGEALERSLGCLGPFGRFIELGKRDIYANSVIGLRALRENITFFAADVDQLFGHRPEIARRCMDRIAEGFEAGSLQAIPREEFPAPDVAMAFNRMLRSAHVGKIVVRPPQLASTGAEPVSSPIRGSWIVTGGTGGFGLATARWLARNGCQHLWLIGRKGALGDAEVAALEKLGCSVDVLACDITDGDAVRGLAARIVSAGRGLNGIVHAAAEVDDAMFEDLTPEIADRSLSVKVRGARNLEALADGFELDHFWLFSSVAARFGNPGQSVYVAANRVLEGIATRRRETGKPGMAIAWGPISDVGMLARNRNLAATISDLAGPLMTSDEALAALGRALRELRPRATLTVSTAASIRLADRLPVAREPLFELVPAAGHSRGEDRIDLADLVSRHGPSEARSVVQDVLRDEAARVLRLPPDEVDALRPLAEMGFDSLMAMNLKLAVEDRLDFELPATALSGEVNLAKLADAIVRGQTGLEDDSLKAMTEAHVATTVISDEDQAAIRDLAERTT